MGETHDRLLLADRSHRSSACRVPVLAHRPSLRALVPQRTTATLRSSRQAFRSAIGALGADDAQALQTRFRRGPAYGHAADRLWKLTKSGRSGNRCLDPPGCESVS